jgi:hypothetical protein
MFQGVYPKGLSRQVQLAILAALLAAASYQGKMNLEHQHRISGELVDIFVRLSYICHINT